MLIQRLEYINRLIALRNIQIIKAIKDHYPKLLLTMDDDAEVHYDGIKKINARDWLLQDYD